MNDKRRKTIRLASAGALCIYLIFMAWRMFFYAYANYHRIQSPKLQYNLVPFKTILELLRNCPRYDSVFWIYNLLGNIAVFVPLGILLVLVIKRNNIMKTFAVSLLLIIFAEIMQLVTRLGVLDVDDIILNMLGCLIGHGVGKLICSIGKMQES